MSEVGREEMIMIKKVKEDEKGKGGRERKHTDESAEERSQR